MTRNRKIFTSALALLLMLGGLWFCAWTPEPVPLGRQSRVNQSQTKSQVSNLPSEKEETWPWKVQADGAVLLESPLGGVTRGRIDPKPERWLEGIRCEELTKDNILVIVDEHDEMIYVKYPKHRRYQSYGAFPKMRLDPEFQRRAAGVKLHNGSVSAADTDQLMAILRRIDNVAKGKMIYTEPCHLGWDSNQKSRPTYPEYELWVLRKATKQLVECTVWSEGVSITGSAGSTQYMTQFNCNVSKQYDVSSVSSEHYKEESEEEMYFWGAGDHRDQWVTPPNTEAEEEEIRKQIHTYDAPMPLPKRF